ncbi:Ger(x)C family spore germination protein [Clostridium rectalis]|uniref:Ger(x)C family spore germination protein n=1 Tax=Clostridium rectalis TaxID=2040295 RepID=UPI000F6437F6|nr:Ger(x)C family spore germination protein [Clostridium rectalis]
MIKNINKLLLLFLLLIMPITLCGCWDYEDIEKRSIVISIGVDKVNDTYEFYGEIAKLHSMTNMNSAVIPESYVDIAYGSNFENGRLNIDRSGAYPTFLGATRIVIFGKNYAEQGIEPYINRINKLYDYRKTLLPVISKDSPKDILSQKIPNDIAVGFFIEHNINTLAKIGESVYPTIGDIVYDINFENIGYVLPYIGIDNGSIRNLGLAILKDSKLIDILTGTDTKGLLYILSKNPSFPETFSLDKDSKNLLSFEPVKVKRHIKTSYVNNTVVIDLNLSLKEKLQYQYNITPIDENKIKTLEKMLQKKIYNEVSSTIDRYQHKFKCDIFRFAKYFRAENPMIYNSINWNDKFPEAKININIDVDIINLNLFDSSAKKQ